MQGVEIYCSKCKRKLSGPEEGGQVASCPGCGAGVHVKMVGCSDCDTSMAVVTDPSRVAAPPPAAGAASGPTKFRLRHVDDDDIETVEPDGLMSAVSKSRLSWTLIVSIIVHVVVILLLSTGVVALCVRYKMVNPVKAIEKRESDKKEEAERKKVEKEEARRQKLVERAKREALRKEEEEKKKAEEAKKAEKDKPVPQVIKDITETSDERPTESGLDSIDDDLE